MRRVVTAGCLLLLSLLPAQADLRLCNRSSYIVYAATAQEMARQTVIQGWTRIVPGDCADAIKGALSRDTYLVYARSSPAHGGPSRAWSGETSLCVRDGDFHGPAATLCRDADSMPVKFAAAPTHGRSDWTTYLDDTPALASLIAAQLAGVRRLLADNGYRTGPLDGRPDKQTGDALKDFRRRMAFKPDDGNDVLFAALERQARLHSAPQGFSICNDAPMPVLAAVAQDDPALSQGWWRLAPHACAKALTADLKGRPVYLFAQTLAGLPLTSGAAPFCTAPAAFRIQGRQNCAGRGLGQAGFMATAGHGLAGFVAHVGESGRQAMSK